MGKISDREMSHWSVAEANTLVGRHFDKEFWLFIIQLINYNELVFDNKNNEIICPGFIPFIDLAIEVINDLDPASVHHCQVCARVFDINKEDGIFGDPVKLDQFICQTCSKAMSAKTFYDKYLVT